MLSSVLVGKLTYGQIVSSSTLVSMWHAGRKASTVEVPSQVKEDLRGICTSSAVASMLAVLYVAAVDNHAGHGCNCVQALLLSVYKQT